MSIHSGIAGLIISMSLCSLTLAGGVIYVEDDAPLGGDGQSWATAYRYLSDGLAAAAASGGTVSTVRIAGGTYYPDESDAVPAGSGDRSTTFLIFGGFNVQGGHAGLSGSTSTTFLSGDLAGDDAPGFTNRADNAYHVVTTDSSTSNTWTISNLTITGGYADGVAPDDKGAGARLEGEPKLLQVEITDCWALGLGGGAFIPSSHSASFDSCLFTGCEAADGGGLAFDDSAGVVFSCSFTANTASRGGGLFAEDDALVDIESCSFTTNHAMARGGGLHVESALVSDATTVHVVNSTFTTNTAITFGGGASNRWSTLTISGSSFTTNSSSNDSGALHTLGLATSLIGETIVSDTTFTGNTAADSGGVSRIEQAVATFSCCQFDSNTADNNGGALDVNNSDLNIFECSFNTNEAGLRDEFNIGGGAIDLFSTPALISGSTFSGNRGADGGAIRGGAANSDPQGVDVTGCAFISNEAVYKNGGACLMGGSTWTLSDCVFDANTAAIDGGALQHNNTLGTSVIDDCEFIRNEAGEDGGAFGINSGDTTMERCRFELNTARYHGAASSMVVGQGGSTADCSYVDCEFIENRTTDQLVARGGAITIERASANFERCSFIANAVPVGGGGAMLVRTQAFVTATNCLFNANMSETTGAGAIHQLASGEVDGLTITNSTFVNNSTQSGAGAIRAGASGGLTMTNTILRGNANNGSVSEADQLDIPGATINYCCIEGLSGALGGTGNIDTDPLFSDTDGPDDIPGNEDDDFTLGTGVSLCIDAGDNSADTDAADPAVNPLPSKDLLGSNRFIDDVAVADSGSGSAPIVDMGAYESGGAAPVPPAPSLIIYVDGSATGNNNGTTWTDAFTDLNDALAQAANASLGTAVWIAQGTYTPAPPGGLRSRTFAIPTGITVHGGFQSGATSTSQADNNLYPTILSGDLDADDAPGFVNRSDNSLHVVTAICTSYSTYLQECTIAGGSSTGVGGGLLIADSNLRVYDCIIEDNEAADAGGGVYMVNGRLYMTTGSVTGNRATNAESVGGGISGGFSASMDLRSLNISNNSADTGGGVYADTAFGSCSIYYSLITNNQALGGGSQGFGGGLAVSALSNRGGFCQVQTSDVSNNSARIAGGIASLGAGDIYVSQTIMQGNVASEQAGGILFSSRSGRLYACDIQTNSAPIAPGILNDLGSTLYLRAQSQITNTTDNLISDGLLYLYHSYPNNLPSLIINGDLTLSGGLQTTSYKRTPYTPFSIGNLQVAGQTTINSGSLRISHRSFASIDLLQGSARIIQSGSVSGTFDSVFVSRLYARGILPTVKYTSDAVDITSATVRRYGSHTPDASYYIGGGRAYAAAGQLHAHPYPELVLASRSPSSPYTTPGSVYVLLNAGSTTTWDGWSSAAQYAVGVDPNDVEIAQYDQQSTTTTDLDVIVSNRGDDTISVFRNLGATLGDRRDIPVGDAPIGLGIADFDNDGLTDVAVANRDDQDVSVLFNQGGSGPAWLGFGGRIDIPLPASPHGISTTDFDNDGDTDLVVATRGAGVVRITNDFSPLAFGSTFTPQPAIEYPEGLTEIVIGDFDGDTNVDFAVINEIDGTLSISCGNGDGTFVQIDTFEIGSNPRSLIVYDSEGDGDDDLALIYTDEELGTLVQEIRNETDAGVITLNALEPVDIGETPFALVAVDVDDDGDIDLLSANDGEAAAAAQRGTPVDVSSLLNDITVSPPDCEGDANGDSTIDVNDISYVLFRLGGFGPAGLVDGDANQDGVVDVNDISYVLFRLGDPCP